MTRRAINIPEDAPLRLEEVVDVLGGFYRAWGGRLR